MNYFFLSCMALFLSTAITAQTTVLGYFPSYRATSVVRYDKLTDVVFAFINPDANGNLIESNPSDATFGFDMNKFIVIKDGSAANNVKLWIALGGADASNLRRARLSSVCNNTSSRGNLVSDLVNFAITHGCYGIDIDWEFPTDAVAKAGHKALLTDLRAAINSSSNPNLKISIAVGGEYTNAVNHLQYIDPSVITTSGLIDKYNVMLYDLPTSYGLSHSTTADAQASMEAWNAKGVPYSKMLLGIPFYGKHQSSRADLAYNAFGGNAATNYTSDSYNGYYYNGKPTIEAKMDLVSSKGSQGILIWDLGQDRTDAYSLLDVIDNKAATLCAVPKANLGPDKGVCAGASITLDPGVAAKTGRVFVWKKDGVTTGGNTATLDVSAAGTYKVEITESGCTREDEIVVVTGSSITTTGASGCNTDQLTLSVNNPDATKTYKWYDAAISGTQLHTGSTYTETFATSTTVYVEEASSGVVEYISDSILPQANYAWQDGSTPRANFLEVFQDVKLKSVRLCVTGETGASFKLQILKASDNSLVHESGLETIAPDATKQSWEYTIADVNVNKTLVAGKYFFTPVMTSGSYTYNFSGFNGSSEAGVYTVGDHAFTDFGNGFLESQKTDASSYVSGGPFYKYVFEVGANASCGRTAATATVQQCGPPTVDITAPTASQVFTYSDPATEANISLTAAVSDEGTVSSVVFEVFKGGVLVETVTSSNNGGTYEGTFSSGVQGSDYTFKVTATDNDANVTTKSVDFEIQKTVGVGELAVLDVQVQPNPSSNQFQLTVGGVSAFQLSVYTVSGQLVSTANVTGNSASFGADLNAGTYVVRAVAASGTYQTQVVKK